MLPELLRGLGKRGVQALEDAQSESRKILYSTPLEAGHAKTVGYAMARIIFLIFFAKQTKHQPQFKGKVPCLMLLSRFNLDLCSVPLQGEGDRSSAVFLQTHPWSIKHPKSASELSASSGFVGKIAKTQTDHPFSKMQARRLQKPFKGAEQLP